MLTQDLKNGQTFRTMSKRVIEIGDIYWVEYEMPPSEVVGHEQGKRRPGIVVQIESWADLAIVVPLTTQPPSKLTRSTAFIPQGVGNLPRDSYALCYQIRSVSYQRLQKKIGKIDGITLEELKEALMDFLDL